jgi:ceramide synthetase
MFVEPLVRYLEISKGHVSAKFAQSTMEALTYGSFAVVGLHVVPLQDFVWPSSQWWEGFAKGGHEIMRSDMRCYYIMYIARYCQALVSVLIEPKMKDFLQMLIHHSVTVTVIYISYIYGWNRVGVVVMALLDPADVPLHLAKLCKYIAEARGQMWQTMADRLFELFALIFFFTRLVCYGYVCWSAHIEATRYFDKGLPEWTCVALLEVLFALQLYWFSLIVKVAVRMIGGQGVDDVRESERGTHAKHD